MFPPILLLFHVLESIQISEQHTNVYASMFVLCKQTIGIFWPGSFGSFHVRIVWTNTLFPVTLCEVLMGSRARAAYDHLERARV